jgi:hypothetical protein
LKALDTQWVAFLDSDDAWLRNKLETQLDIAKKFNSKALCTNAVLSNPSDSPAYFAGNKNLKLSIGDLLRDNRVITSSTFLDRELLISVGGVATSFLARGAEDYATWLRVATLTQWFYVAEPLTIYFNESTDSFRSTTGFPQNYVRYFGLLDFQSWLESKTLSHTWPVRLYLKGLSIAIKLSQKKK